MQPDLQSLKSSKSLSNRSDPTPLSLGGAGLDWRVGVNPSPADDIFPCPDPSLPGVTEADTGGGVGVVGMGRARPLLAPVDGVRLKGDLGSPGPEADPELVTVDGDAALRPGTFSFRPGRPSLIWYSSTSFRPSVS